MNSLEMDYMSNKIAVVFPGLGYHCDKPLLYHSKKLAKQYGYEIKEIHYEFTGEILDVKNNEERMIEAIEEFTNQAKEQLLGISLKNYSSVLFIGKSIGTAIGARIAKEMDISVSQLVFTPVADTLQNLPKENVLVFHGLSDPWCDNKIVDDAKKKIGFELRLIDGANHSLETGNVLEDIVILKDVIENTNAFIAKFEG